MGGSSPSPPTQQTVTQRSEPPAYARPYIEQALAAGKSQILDQPLSYYPGSTVVPFSPETQAAMSMQTDRALSGSPLTGAAQSGMLSTLNGDYLAAGNPHMQRVMSSLESNIRPQIDSAFIGSGRAGSPAHAETYTRALADAAAPYMFSDYGAERDRMMKASTVAPLLAQADYQDIQQLGAIGAAREGKTAEYLADDMARHQFEQMEPYQRIMPFAQLAYTGAGTGGSSTYNSPQWAPASAYAPGALDWFGTTMSAAGPLAIAAKM